METARPVLDRMGQVSGPMVQVPGWTGQVSKGGCAGQGPSGAGSAMDAAGFVLGREPAPAEVRGRPICGAG